MTTTASAEVATPRAGQTPYQPPPDWAEFLASLLPCTWPETVVDWQAGDGCLFAGFSATTTRFAVEIDPRCAPAAAVLHADCTKIWELLDDLYPQVRFECQVANTLVGISWKVPSAVAPATVALPTDAPTTDAPTYWAPTAYTWRQVQRWALPGGYGYFIADRSILECLGIHRHPWVYLYQTFPPGLFPRTGVEVGVVHWCNAADDLRRSQHWDYRRVDRSEFEANAASLRARWRRLSDLRPPTSGRADFIHDWASITDVWATLHRILVEVEHQLPPFSVWLDADQRLQTHLSLRQQVKGRFDRQAILRLAKLRGLHPMALVVEPETRRLLADLVRPGRCTVEPAAAAAIRGALDEATRVSMPIMPIGDFQRMAYVEELDCLTVRPEYQAALRERRPTDAPTTVAPSHRLPLLLAATTYPIDTGTYRFHRRFKRLKPQLVDGVVTTVTHDCEISGTDGYLEATDDAGVVHRFLDHPSEAEGPRQCHLHPSHLLWEIFLRPDVPTVAELNPDQVSANRRRLEAMAVP